MSWQVGGNCFQTLSAFPAADSQTLSVVSACPPSPSRLTSASLLPLCPSPCLIGSVMGLSEGRKEEGEVKRKEGEEGGVLLAGYGGETERGGRTGDRWAERTGK